MIFLSAIAQPCVITLTGELWGGKIGIWAFGKELLAACNSKNCPKGTLEWHQVSANKEQVCCMLVEKVLPAINMKWLVRWRQKTVLCQQDNASSHLLSYNTKCLAACKEKKLSIQLSYQPVQLPDLNVKNLGLFFLLIACKRESLQRT